MHLSVMANFQGSVAINDEMWIRVLMIYSNMIPMREISYQGNFFTMTMNIKTSQVRFRLSHYGAILTTFFIAIITYIKISNYRCLQQWFRKTDRVNFGRYPTKNNVYNRIIQYIFILRLGKRNYALTKRRNGAELSWWLSWNH